MVRPKTSRNGNSKRNRTSYQEEKINAKLRDYDILADSLVANLETIFNDKIEEISRAFKIEKNRLPKHVLQMRMGDLRLTGASTFADLDKISIDPPQYDTMSSMGSSQLSSSYIPGSKAADKKQSRADEGYITEDSATSNRNSDLLSSAKARPYGPLASAMKNRRRSKSVSANATPSKQHSSLLLAVKSKKTFGGSQTLYADSTNRLSRSKFRTPGPANRLQHTVSADRGMTMITPKVQPNTPMAMLRHARLGESVYSITGSPVITATMGEEMANVNIPIQNGMLSLRPTEMDSIDTGLVQKIDPDTLEHLKKLQMNLNKIMQLAEVNNFQKM